MTGTAHVKAEDLKNRPAGRQVSRGGVAETGQGALVEVKVVQVGEERRFVLPAVVHFGYYDWSADGESPVLVAGGSLLLNQFSRGIQALIVVVVVERFRGRQRCPTWSYMRRSRRWCARIARRNCLVTIFVSWTESKGTERS